MPNTKDHMRKPIGSEVQSVMFDVDKFTISSAKKWLSDNNFTVMTVSKGENGDNYRFKQYNPDRYESMRTISAGVEGIKFIVGFKESKKIKKAELNMENIINYMSQKGFSDEVKNIVVQSLSLPNTNIQDISDVLSMVNFEFNDKLHVELSENNNYNNNLGINFRFVKSQVEEKKYSKNKIKALKKCIKFIKGEDDEKRIVYGIVAEPESVDTDNEWISEGEIEKACHEYMKKHQKVGIEHKGTVDYIKVVENYIAPVNMVINNEFIKKGSWIQAHYIEDISKWEDVKNGELTGFSLEGFGILTNQVP